MLKKYFKYLNIVTNISKKKKEEKGSHPWDIINSFMPGNFLQFCISHCAQKNIFQKDRRWSKQVEKCSKHNEARKGQVSQDDDTNPIDKLKEIKLFCT